MQLSNGLVKFGFDDATGSLCQIKDLKTGKEYLQDPRGWRLVKLIAPTFEHSSRPLFSHLSGAPRMQKQGDTLTISFPQVSDGGKATGISIKIKVRLSSGSPEAIFTLELRNDGPATVQEVWFPWVGGHHMKFGDKRETITTSWNSANFSTMFPTKRTHTFSRSHQKMGFADQKLLPMMDLSDQDGGVSYIRYDDKPCYKNLVFTNESNDYLNTCMTWAWASRPFLKTGHAWTSAEFGVGVHQGDWHATADRLRRYKEKWWQPSGTPSSLREKIGLYHVQFSEFSGKRVHEFGALPDMARDCLKYGVADICMWENTAQLYLRADDGGFWEMPPERLASLKRALAETRRLGCHVGAWVNFRLITECARLWKEMEAYAIRSVYGKPITESYPGSMESALSFEGTSLLERQGHRLCQGSDGFRKFALDLVERTMELGFSTLFIDQANEPQSCLAENHGHKTPEEARVRTYEWFGEATRRVHKLCSEAYTGGELPDLYNTQSIDLWWEWGWRNGFSANIFRYVIPEMIPCWCIDENERDVLSKAFAMGSFLAIATRDMTGKLSDEPALAQHIARLAKLRKATAPFVSHGRFLDNRGLSVEHGNAYVFASDAGLAVTMANGKATQKTLEITLTPEETGFVPAGKGLLHIEGAEPIPIAPTRRGGKWSLEVKVPAYGAAIWTMERKKTI
ncbi:MAG: DUF6259 domain-containing protein [Verrucomicrobiota bacterium]